MDKPLLALTYHGPSHAIDVLECVAQRETLRLGLPWTDLPFRERHEYLVWASWILDGTLLHLRREPLTAELGVIPGGGIRTLLELSRVEGWLGNRHVDCLDRARTLGGFRAALEGRDH